jgi:hypothetical protein
VTGPELAPLADWWSSVSTKTPPAPRIAAAEPI